MELTLASIVTKVTGGRKTKAEKTDSHPFPAIIIYQTPEKGSRKESQFELSAMAIALLGIDLKAENLPSIAFLDGNKEGVTDLENRAFLLVIPHGTEYADKFPQLRKNGRFSSALLHTWINTLPWVDTSKEDKVFELVLTPNTTGFTGAEIKQVIPDTIPFAEEEVAAPEAEEVFID